MVPLASGMNDCFVASDNIGDFLAMTPLAKNERNQNS